MQTEAKPKIFNLDLLRLFASCAIVMFHLFGGHLHISGVPLYEMLYNASRQGRLATDLFFILSGFFLVYTFKPSVNLRTFIKKRVLRFWPVLIFIICCHFILSLFGLFNFDLYRHFITFTGIIATGYVGAKVSIGRFWYVSALLLVSIALYYLMLRVTKRKRDEIVGALVIFAYTILVTMPINFDGIVWAQMWHGIISVGMLRAIGGVGLGYLIARWYEQYCAKEHLPDTKTRKMAFTVIESIALLLSIGSVLCHLFGYQYNILVIGIFVITIGLLLAKRGWLSQKLNTIDISFLSRYTYSMFMSHPLVFVILRQLIWKPNRQILYNEPVGNLILTITMVVLMTLITYHCVELPAKRWAARINRKQD